MNEQPSRPVTARITAELVEGLHHPDALAPTLKRAAAVLRDAKVPFMLCGSMACWARGGPEPLTKDVDFCVKPADAERALAALADAGMRTEHPDEGWLLKAWDEHIQIDLLFAPADQPVTDATLNRSDELTVMATAMRVASVTDVVTTKLLALNEHSLDYQQLLQITRALREQIDWPEVSKRTQHWPYAAAFLTLIERLGIVSAEELARPRAKLAPDLVNLDTCRPERAAQPETITKIALDRRPSVRSALSTAAATRRSAPAKATHVSRTPARGLGSGHAAARERTA